MKLATVRTAEGTQAVRIDEGAAVEVGARDVGELLARPDWREHAAAATGAAHDRGGLDYAPLVSHPEKIVCVGLNYRAHILEMGRELPPHPTLFAKYSRALIGAFDDIAIPAGVEGLDWEGELAVVIGAPVRHADEDAARSAIAGYTVCNDVSARDWQYRTTQWLQGKTFEATTPLGPWLVTADEADPPAAHATLECEVNGETMQKADTGDMVFDPATLVAYLSEVFTLVPGDVISTGTPGGVGHARNPRRYLGQGDVVVTRIEGIGECRNRCRRQGA